MAGAGTKRIVDLTETSEVQNGDYLAIDSTARGTKKTPVSIFAKAADLTAEQTARAAADTTLDGKITAEAQARANAIGAEQTAREEADDALTESVTALSGEVTAQGELIQNPTKTVSGAVAHFTDGADMPATSVIVSIEPQQSGTGTPSPDNVRPISGWESVSVTDAGKNLFDESTMTVSSTSWTTTAIEVPNGTYTVSTNAPSDKVLLYARVGDGQNTQVYEGRHHTLTVTDGLPIKLQYRATDASYKTSDYWYQIEAGATPTEHERYNPNSSTTPVNLGRTVYGGTLDIMSGVLTVTHGYQLFDGSSDEDIRPYAGTRITIGITDYLSPAVTIKDTITANYLQTVNKSAQGTGVGYISGGDVGTSRIMINLGSSTLDEAKSYLASNPLQVVYPLVTPQTYTLTPTEIQTLLGENNVWADAGAVSVTYRRDINLALEQLEALLNG